MGTIAASALAAAVTEAFPSRTNDTNDVKEFARMISCNPAGPDTLVSERATAVDPPASGLDSRCIEGTSGEMEFLVWAGMFLLLAVVGSMVTLFGMVGVPIGSDLQAALFILAALVGGTGMAVFLATPTLTPRQSVDWLKRIRQ